MARSTIDRSDCRLVMSPATCGSGARGAKAAPPLKSTSTKASCSGGWVAARPATIVRNSSLLPEPVAPTTRPCGPIPPSAASLRSRTSGSPAGPTPTGTLRSSSRGRNGSSSPWGPTAPSDLAGRRAGRGDGRARFAKPLAAGGRAGGAPGAGRWSRRWRCLPSRRGCRSPGDRWERSPGASRTPGRRRGCASTARTARRRWSRPTRRPSHRPRDTGHGDAGCRGASRRGTLEPFLDPGTANGPSGSCGAVQTSRGVGDRTRFGRVEDRQQVRAGAGAGLGVGEQGGGWLVKGGRGVASGWVAGVREPSHPVPGRAGGGWMGGEDLEVVGSVEGGELADQGAGEGACPGRWAGEGQDGELAEGNGHRGVGEPACSADEILRRREEVGVVLGEWATGGVEPGRGCEGDGAAADPHREEVGVAWGGVPRAGWSGRSSPRASAGRGGGARRRRAGRRPAG